MTHEIERYPGELRVLRAVYEAVSETHRGSSAWANRVDAAIAAVKKRASEDLDNMVQHMEDGRG